MSPEICMMSGVSKSNPLTSIAIEGPEWAGQRELYDHLLKKLYGISGWVGIQMPLFERLKAHDLFDYAGYISNGPTSKVIYNNHILPLISHLHPTEKEVDVACLQGLRNILYVVVQPELSMTNIHYLYKNFGLPEKVVRATATKYAKAAELSGLSYMVIETMLTNSLWKYKAYHAIKKKIGIFQ